jgi:hypothetical protein
VALEDTRSLPPIASARRRYVADGYGKVIDGTLIGDILGNSIYARSQNGFGMQICRVMAMSGQTVHGNNRGKNSETRR